MGHSRVSKQQSHQQIVSTSASCFREYGVNGISIANLMKAAGMTHGGFYKHFDSRDQLVFEALDFALSSSSKRYQAMGEVSFESFVEQYLSSEHRDNLAGGCAMAALVNDAPRLGSDSRALYSSQFRKSVSWIASLLSDPDENARSQAMVIFSILIGAIGFARALDDEVLATEVLRSAQEHILSQFGSSK